MHRTSRHVTAAEQSRLVFLPYHHIADGLYITAVSSPKPRLQDLIDQFIGTSLSLNSRTLLRSFTIVKKSFSICSVTGVGL